MKALIIILCAMLVGSALGNTVMPCGPFDKETSVSTPEQAIAAAKRAWLSVYSKASWHAIYGPEGVTSFEPYSAYLDEGIWHVSGSARNGKRGPVASVCASNGAASVRGT
jgi:hypothetical protein